MGTAAEQLLEKLAAGLWTGEGSRCHYDPEADELYKDVTFADLSFAAFQPYINVLDPGGPYKTHTITKEARHLNAVYWQIKRRGKKPTLLSKDGTIFHPWKDYKRHIYGPEHVEKHIFEKQVSYYTSDSRGLGLIYMDVDAHEEYQTDEYDGLDILRELFSAAYYRASRRGQNQYLKVRYSSPEQFNALCDKVQENVRLLFLSRGILCDFETKGKITTDRESDDSEVDPKSGSLAKLPFTTRRHCNMRDETDSWDFPSLIRFHTSPVYSVEEIEAILDNIVVDGEAIMQTVEKKEALEKPKKKLQPVPKKATAESIEQPQPDPTPGNAIVGIVEPPVEFGILESGNAEEEQPTPFGILENRNGAAAGNAFTRNWKVLPGFVRRFYRQHRRIPTTDEALAYLHDNGLFSGKWEDNATGRRTRVAAILKKIAESFDETKLGTGEHQEVDPRKHGWWVSQHFGAHMRATVEKRTFDLETMTYPKRSVDVPLRFVCGFLAAAEIVLRKTEDGRVATNWFKDLFKQMGISWNQDYYMATREKLHSMGVIQITDRHHYRNVAWTWAPCMNIPASWKEEQRDCKAKLVKRDPEELPSSFLDTTVYTMVSDEIDIEIVSAPARPPPDDEDGAEIYLAEAYFGTICEESLF